MISLAYINCMEMTVDSVFNTVIKLDKEYYEALKNYSKKTPPEYFTSDSYERYVLLTNRLQELSNDDIIALFDKMEEYSLGENNYHTTIFISFLERLRGMKYNINKKSSLNGAGGRTK